MGFVIDGHNLIGATPDLEFQDPDAPRRLVFLLRAWAARERRRGVRLVFDRGLPGGEDPGLSTRDLRVIFAGAGETADHRILAMIRGDANPAGTVLVTGDRALARAAGALGTRVESPARFLRRLARTAPAVEEKPGPPGAGQVEEWLELFRRGSRG